MMAVLAGIDEAGYGPTLGPLVVGATLWRVEQRHVDADFWRLLRGCVGRATARGDAILKVDDSKLAFDRKRGLGSLERAVLAFAHTAGMPCESLGALRAALGCGDDGGPELPWDARVDVALPIDPTHGVYAAIAGRLGAVCQKAGARCERMWARVVTPQRFNERVRQTDNKASVLIEHVFELLTRIAQHAGHDPVYVCVDHLGGRSNYRDLLMAVFPQRRLAELEVNEATSAYELTGDGAPWRITFAVEADRRSMPVALASMLAKYLREALMDRFNAYWRSLLPALRPTAGYHGDAQRFLADIAPVLPASGIALHEFVRER